MTIRLRHVDIIVNHPRAVFSLFLYLKKKYMEFFISIFYLGLGTNYIVLALEVIRELWTKVNGTARHYILEARDQLYTRCLTRAPQLRSMDLSLEPWHGWSNI